ncbi:MAG: SNF2-related protein [Ferruginibacter sp.]|nr:SNF2-related protein [Ferruginibacter sp.]
MSRTVPLKEDLHEVRLEGMNFTSLTTEFILSNSSALPDTGSRHFLTIHPDVIQIDAGSFTNPGTGATFPAVAVIQEKDAVFLSCMCSAKGDNLCSHQAQVLFNILEREDLRIFFDAAARREKVLAVAKNYGLQEEKNLDELFEISWSNRTVVIAPRSKNLQQVTTASLAGLASELFPARKPGETETQASTVLVFNAHKYYHHLQVAICPADLTSSGKVKKLHDAFDPLEQAWQTNDAATVKFYTALTAIAANHDKTVTPAALLALKAIVKNPLALPAYYHDTFISDKLTSASLIPVHLNVFSTGLQLRVYLREPYYEISGELQIGDSKFPLTQLHLRYGYFILLNGTLHLPAQFELLQVLTYFKKHNNVVVVHQSKFDEFRKTILAKLEDFIQVNYAWLVVATSQQLEESGFDLPPEKIIYISESGQYVTVSPVMRYGEVEVSVLSKRQLFARDQVGKAFIVDRDEAAELELTTLLLKQHSEFEEQLFQEHFYLTKIAFLENGWFLDAFEEWRRHGIKVLGFKEIDQKRLNTHKAAISVQVASGQDWFDTDLDVRYGKQKASLRQLHKALKNGSQYVLLGDGSFGLLPAEWVDRMSAYFEAGEILEDVIRTPKNRLLELEKLYAENMLSAEVREQLSMFRQRLASFESIGNASVPAGLNAELRSYQHQGLNWLNFLDDYGFGGCLADDMGLGKTIQVIAFMLSVKERKGQKTNLVVVPASLIFNWQEELLKFAPGLKVLTIYGNDRVKNTSTFPAYDVVLTSYGMVQSNLYFLKNFIFHYMFLDESQAIKNPASQRYKSVCSLRAFNRIVITGTPVENNSFDLYGQLSFACPGLLGSLKYFRDVYAFPIDKFSDSKRAKELQKMVSPFILRRTKKQVATELPEKTEMVIYCEMGDEQRKVYDAYEKEFRNYLLDRPEEDLPRDGMNILQGLTKLRLICNSPALLKDQAFFGDASSKIAVLIEQIETKYRQHKILVFSQFVGMLKLVRKELAERYIPYEYLTGETANRKEVVTAFREQEEVRVFLVSLKAGGTGLNLTEADYVYILDPWWNPAVENQAIDRCYRIGQEKHVVAVRLICPGTLEEKMMKLQATKTERINDLIKTDLSVMKQLKKEDLLALVTNNEAAK